MAAVKRTLFTIRLGDDSEDDHPEGDEPTSISVDEESGDDGVGRPYAWVGLGVASLGGLAAAAYKLVQYRKAASEVEPDEPWRVEEESTRLPDDAGTASLVGLVFVAGLTALGKRLERDPWA